ncbi:MAG: hypothetical protein LC749_16060, partial [Actinobacteria bacterium]|nr:hypothetical protein [Actinomycetota bacterium]
MRYPGCDLLASPDHAVYPDDEHSGLGRAFGWRCVSHDNSVINQSAPARRGVLDVKRVIEILAAVVPPLTALTALLGYVGWIRSKAFFSYFGIDQGLLHLSIQDYVVRSADVTFGAVARLLAALVILALGDRLLARVQEPTDRSGHPQKTGTARGRWLPRALTVIGLALSLAGLLFAVGLGKNWGLP